jgi:serine/threonine-protein kinase
MQLTTLDGRYRIVERIAAGGMGEVFRAHDAVLAREVAIKVLHRSLAGDPGFIERFRREARAAAVLNHPNIAAVYDWGAVDGIYYMVMEFVPGESLRELLNRSRRLAPAQAADALGQILAALDHAHRQGIVHRDIKPENVIVTPDGVAKVADFGLARAFADGTVTQAGAVTGTVQYLAPEQIRGEPADPRTDLYSVGILAYELLTGRLPFTGETSMAIAYKHLSHRVPAPSKIVADLPSGLDGFVGSATERDRELRPESAAEMRRDLAQETRALPVAKPLADLVDEQPIVVPEAGPERAETVTIPRPEPTKVRRRRRRRLFGKVLLILTLLGATAWATWTYVIPHTIAIPNVIGTSIDRAQTQLVEQGLKVAVAPKGVYSLRIDRGDVLRTSPKIGSEIHVGDRVVLVPSLGPRPVDVPQLEGLTVDRAKAAAADAGLNLDKPKRRYDLRVPEGRIVVQKPGSGQLPEGSEISVIVSKGPPPVKVPSLQGQTIQAATSALQAAGLTPSVSERFSDTVARDMVISQVPAPSKQIPQGSAVSLIVSKGPDRFKLPTLKGLSKADALTTLSKLGLNADVVTLPSTNGDTVKGQDPAPGTVVHAGATITIYLA